MKKLFSILLTALLVLGLLTSCAGSEKPYSAYSEICDTESYYENIVSMPALFTNFSVGKYANFYVSYNGLICKFYDTGEMTQTYEGTLGFSAPYFYDGYIYAVSNGYLYKIDSSRKGTVTQISDKMDGAGANCVVVNDSFALVTLHHYDEHDRFSVKLMRVDLLTGMANELELGSEQRLYCSAGGVMYVYARETDDRETVYSLYEIPADGEPVYICDMTDIGETPRFVLEGGVFYYADKMGDLCGKSLITGDTYTIVAGAGIYDMGEYSESGMTFYEGNIFYYNGNTASIETVYTPSHELSGKPIVKICALYGKSVAHIDIDALSRYTDAELNYTGLFNFTDFNEDAVALKILAGDTDVDIYFVSASLAGKLLEKNIYTPIESEVVKSFNNSCFDYIADACVAENGDIAFMPISNYVYGIVYPTASFEEAGITRDELLYYDSFMDTVRNKKTSKHVFQLGDVIYNSLLKQYSKYYCDFENGEFDFTSDVVAKFFTELCTYYPDYDSWEPYGFMHPQRYDPEVNPELVGKEETAQFSSDLTLMTISAYNYYSYATGCSDFFDGWRAVPMPRLSEDVPATYVEAEFAIINPYSQNKEAAVSVLEDIAENYMSVRGGQAKYSFLLEDKAAYSDDYHPDSQVFADFYDIAKEGFVFTYEIGSASICDDFSKGLISAEEALEELQRQVDIYMNE